MTLIRQLRLFYNKKSGTSKFMPTLYKKAGGKTTERSVKSHAIYNFHSPENPMTSTGPSSEYPANM